MKLTQKKKMKYQYKNSRKVENYWGWGGLSLLSWWEELGLELKEGIGFSPLMNQPSAKKAVPARMAVPQAW
jgi:hypothetical protein